MSAPTGSSYGTTLLELSGQSVGRLAGGIAFLLVWVFSLTSDRRPFPLLGGDGRTGSARVHAASG